MVSSDDGRCDARNERETNLSLKASIVEVDGNDEIRTQTKGGGKRVRLLEVLHVAAAINVVRP